MNSFATNGITKTKFAGEKKISKYSKLTFLHFTLCTQPICRHRCACADTQSDWENLCSNRICFGPWKSQMVIFEIGSMYAVPTMQYHKSQCRCILSTVSFYSIQFPPSIHAIISCIMEETISASVEKCVAKMKWETVERERDREREELNYYVSPSLWERICVQVKFVPFFPVFFSSFFLSQRFCKIFLGRCCSYCCLAMRYDFRFALRILLFAQHDVMIPLIASLFASSATENKRTN